MKLQDFDFRIWDNIENKYIKTPHGLYIENTEHNDASNCNRIIANYEQRAFYIDYPFNDRNNEYYDNEESLSIELFTGLYDKKGNKIYEGDIAKIITFSYDFVGHVAYDKEETRFKLIDNKYMEDFANYEDWDSIEVIGNIHENKELLRI
ncbi:YopX family protein [Campylobacter coli]